MSKLKITRGDDTTIAVEIKDEAGVAVNITGYTVFFTVKRNKADDDEDAIISKTITSHTDASAGETEIVLTNTDTDVAIGAYLYDIQYKDPQGKITSSEPQSLDVVADITQRTT